MGQFLKRKMDIFGRRFPAWLLVVALAMAGAGAATGIVLADSISGRTTVAVSQAVLVAAPPLIGGDADEGLGTVEDDGAAFAAHFEANNGDIVLVFIPLKNEAGPDQNIVVEFRMAIPEGLTVSIDADGVGVHNDVVRIGPSAWVFTLDGAAAGGSHGITMTVAIEDAQSTGFYETQGTFIPQNV